VGWVRMYTQNMVIMFVEKRRWWMALRWVSRCEDGKLLELAVEHVCDSSTERSVSTRRPVKRQKQMFSSSRAVFRWRVLWIQFSLFNQNTYFRHVKKHFF